MNILLISSDAIDTTMAGPGIRYWEFARHLSRQHSVTLLTPNTPTLSLPGCSILQHTPDTRRIALQQADVIVTQGYLYPVAPLLLCDKPLVIDLYDPLPVELLEHHAHLPLTEAQLSQSYCVERTKLLLRRGDMFLYSHERQRDYWLGMMTAVGRVNHRAYRHDASFHSLFIPVPFGMADQKFAPSSSPLRGSEKLFTSQDTIMLWGGGLWNWFDPCTIIRAIAEITAQRQDIKLLFLGAKRATSDAPGLNIAYATQEAIELSKRLNLFERTVFFHEGWIPYTERAGYLHDANIGISTHFNSLETRLSFRTRLLDYLWAELPIISTKGDYLSELVERHELGITIAPQDVVQIQQAILRVTDDHAFQQRCRDNIRRIRPQLSWSHAIQPLADFCASPYRTSSISRPVAVAHLTRFHLSTIGILLKNRGYRKIFEKLTRKLSLI